MICVPRVLAAHQFGWVVCVEMCVSVFQKPAESIPFLSRVEDTGTWRICPGVLAGPVAIFHFKVDQDFNFDV